MHDESEGYQAYVLRLWRVRCHGCWQWRASIRNPHTGEHYTFAALAGLSAFLEDKTRRETPLNGIDRQDAGNGAVPNEEEKRHDV